jgi:hypothetical protein
MGSIKSCQSTFDYLKELAMSNQEEVVVDYGIDIKRFRVGDKVNYQPSHFKDNEWENGRIKEIRDECNDAVWVVYNCANQWDRYFDYTSAKTNLRDLKLGWRFR